MQCSLVPGPFVVTRSTGQVIQRIRGTFIQSTDNPVIGYITLGDIMEILPFEDSLVVLELDGETVWAALEKGLEAWPAQEG